MNNKHEQIYFKKRVLGEMFSFDWFLMNGVEDHDVITMCCAVVDPWQALMTSVTRPTCTSVDQSTYSLCDGAEDEPADLQGRFKDLYMYMFVLFLYVHACISIYIYQSINHFVYYLKLNTSTINHNLREKTLTCMHFYIYICVWQFRVGYALIYPSIEISVEKPQLKPDMLV